MVLAYSYGMYLCLRLLSVHTAEEIDSGLSHCIHVSDIGNTTWNAISHRQQVCIWQCASVAYFNYFALHSMGDILPYLVLC